MIILIILLLKGVLNVRYSKYVGQVFFEKEIQKLFALYIIIYFVSFLIFAIEAINSYADTGFIKLWTLVGIQLFTGGLVIAFIRNDKYEKNIFLILIDVFVIQAFIQFLSFTIPKIKQMTDIFRTDDVILRGGSIRGLSLDRYDYFNLGAAYGLLYIILAFRWDEWKEKNIFMKIIKTFFLIYGGMASARTSLVALAMAGFLKIIMEVIKIEKKRKKKRNIKNIFIVAISLITITVLVSYLYITYQPFKNLIEFVFIIFINYKEGNGFTSVSTTDLQEMYFSLSLKTFFFGDGHFLDRDGHYYMQTDAGYMRLIMYFGMWGFSLLFLFQRMFLKCRSLNKMRKKESFWVMVYILVINIKGATVGCMTILLSILLLLNFSESEKNGRLRCVI